MTSSDKLDETSEEETETPESEESSDPPENSSSVDDQGEEGGDEGEDEDELADDDVAASEGSRKGVKRAKGMTPGERLAAAKARKARAKQTKRGRDAEVVETQVLKKADEMGQWVQKNRSAIWMGLGAAVFVAAGLVFWQTQRSSAAADASGLLWDAVETANAEIRAEGDTAPEGEEDEETFPDVSARAESALTRFQEVISKFPDTTAAVWAHLGEGSALMALERADEARSAFQAALDSGGSDPAVERRALEGMAFTYESAEQWDEAIGQFERLGQVSGGRFRETADYHTARMHLAKGDEIQGKEALQAVIERVRNEREDDDPELDYVLTQAEIRLMEIDSSLVPNRRSSPNFSAGAGGGDGNDMTPEQMEELLKMLNKQGFSGGGPAGAPGAPPDPNMPGTGGLPGAFPGMPGGGPAGMPGAPPIPGAPVPGGPSPVGP